MRGNNYGEERGEVGEINYIMVNNLRRETQK